MRKLLLVFLVPIMCYGQGDQTIITVPINANGTTFQAILHLPNDYGTTNTAYPLLMFFHGLGEGGANPSTIYTSSSAGGPAYFIAQGTFPTSFVNPKDGKSYKYIVVSPQANPQGVQGSTTAQELDYILTYLYAHYRVDTSRVYLTGLSDGGETAVEYVGGEMTNGGNFTRFTKKHHVAAIIPMSENASAGLFQEEADSITADKIPAWGFGSTDTQGQNTMQLAWYCNQIKPGSMITTSYSGGHCCWGQFFDPTFTQNGMSIYQWLLQYTYGPSAPAVTTPVANAGTAQTIQLPTSQASLSGSASTVTNGTIAAYSWTEQSGPSSAAITASTAASTLVTGLSAGAYVFALKITDNTSKTSTATVQVTVNAAGSVVTTPVANAGTAQTIQLPTSQASLSGSASTVTNGTIGAYSWTEQSGPSSAAITASTAASTLVTGLSAGAYVFALKITDNTGKTSTATVQVTVNAAGSASATLAANAGPAQTIQSPTSQITLSSAASTAASGNKIISCYWTQQYGPSNANIASPPSATTVASGLVVGGYLFGLKIMDNTGNTSTATVQVTVTAASANPAVVQSGVAIPGKIEAESYSSMSGVLTNPTTDAGGGLYVGWINQGDWMDYQVNAAAAGNYTVSFRLAAPAAGGAFQLRATDGSVLTTITVPVTPGWDNFATVNAVVTLPAGAQTLQVYSTSTVSWNINWMQFVSGGTTTSSAQSAAMNFGLDSATTIPNGLDSASFALYPNPVKSTFTVGVNNGRTGNMVIQVIDVTGAIRQRQILHKDQSPMLINMSAADLPAGVYFVRVQVGAWSNIQKLLKY